MPKAKYEKYDGYYYTYVKTNEIGKDGYAKYKKIKAKTCAALDKKVEEYNKTALFNLDATKMTVDQWYDVWFVSYKSNLKANTKNFYKNIYESYIQPHIGSALLTSVKELHCQQILTNMTETHAEKTIKSVRSVLYSLFDKARANHLIMFNPASDLSARGKAAKERRALTEEERTAYLNAAALSTFREYAALLYFFGLRRGEAVAVKGSDFSGGYLYIRRAVTYPDNNQPVIADTKTKAGIRKIPIPEKAKKYIDIDSLPQDFIFAGADSVVLTLKELNNRWKKFIDFAFPDGTDITPHYLRHNYATMLFENGIDLLTVKELCGHEDINTTLKIYTHYTETLQKRCSSKVRNIG